MQTLDEAHFLLTSDAVLAAQHLYTKSLGGSQLLVESERLRKEFQPNQASALITLVTLRQRAAKNFPQAEQLYFTRESLEQATAWEVARYRAAWIHKNAPPGKILDLGCGIGGDLIHLAQYREVIAYEMDPVRACFATANVDALGISDQVEVCARDWVEDMRGGNLPSAAAAFVDPARRVNGRRVFHVEKMIPPLSTVLALKEQIPMLCIKLMPGIKDKEIPVGSSVKFISHQGTCKEAMLWVATTQSENVQSSRSAAVYLSGNGYLSGNVVERQQDQAWIEIDASQQQPPLGKLEPDHFLHEPDPAVIRAGAFWELCQQMNGWLFDPQIAYLVTCSQQSSPLVQSFRVLEVHAFNLKQLNQRISVLNIGQVELKKRGMPFEPESIRGKLKLIKGGIAGVVIFTRQGANRLMIIAERIKSS